MSWPDCTFLSYGWLKKGYRYFRVGNETVRAIKFFYEEKYGPVPDGYVLDHQCDETECCNPDHVALATQAENTHRGMRSKLDWEKVNEIRKSNLTQEALALKFDVSQATISDVKLYKKWIP